MNVTLKNLYPITNSPHGKEYNSLPAGSYSV